MNKMFKLLIRFLLVLALILGGLWWYFNYAPQPSTASQTTDMSINASALFAEYEANEAASNKKYIDKFIQVSGEVGEKLTDENGAPVIILRKPNDMAGVMCTLEPSQQSAFDALNVGDQATVKGKCTGMLMDVVLNKCILMEN